MWLNIAVLVVILSYCRCTDINCYKIFHETPMGELECIQDSGEYYDDDSSCDKIDATNITVNVVNSSVGSVSVEFNLLPRYCKYEKYNLELFVNEHVTTKEECERLTNAASALHSKRFLKIQDQELSSESSLPLCERTGTVIFKYVYTGCYQLKIEEANRMFDDMSVPIFLETGYKKELIINKRPVITRQYRPSQQQIDIGFQLSTYGDFQDLQMNFQLMSGIDPSEDDPCYVSGYEHSCCAYRTSGDFMCRVIGTNDDKPVCSISHDEIIWTVRHVTPGNYCVLVELIDDRCEKFTVWNNKSLCRYNSHIIEVPETSTTVEELVPSSPAPTPIYVILLSIFVVLVALCLCILIYFWRRRGPRTQPGGMNSLKKCPSTRPRIVLLYSRDCKAFMNLMTTFREMLKIVTKCEVLDSFDPALVEEVCRNKVDWLTKYLTCPDVKVVIVESKCAVLHEKALVQSNKLIYRDLCTSEDDLFLYGLRLLRDNLNHAYDRTFVIRINGFTEPEDNLSHLVPYIRYVIPQHTEKLLNSLYQQKTLEYVLIIDENTDSIFKKLNEDTKTLESYKQQNQDYLSKLLEIT